LRRPKTRIDPLCLPLVAEFLALAVLLHSYDPFLIHALRLIAFASCRRLAPAACDPQLPVRIVDIDSESLRRINCPPADWDGAYAMSEK